MRIKDFDLIIIDEICFSLNHFKSELMGTEKEEMYGIFEKLIAMDGDFSNRENYYLKSVVGKNNIEIYENEYKLGKYYF